MLRKLFRYEIHENFVHYFGTYNKKTGKFFPKSYNWDIKNKSGQLKPQTIQNYKDQVREYFTCPREDDLPSFLVPFELFDKYEDVFFSLIYFDKSK